MCQGKAVVEMCLPFLKEKAESFSDKIIGNTPNAIMVLNEDLIVEQINKAALQRCSTLRSADDILHGPVVRMLDPTDYLNVVHHRPQHATTSAHYVAEYKIFVEETILVRQAVSDFDQHHARRDRPRRNAQERISNCAGRPLKSPIR